MGIGKIARSVGKVGLLLEGIGYLWSAGAALARIVRGRQSEQTGDGAADVEPTLTDGDERQAADQDHLHHP